MSRLSDFAGVELSAVYPTLPLKQLGDAAFGLISAGDRMVGFIGDGDFIQLPLTVVDTIKYSDSGGTLLWTVDLADLDGGASHFGGFIFDNDLIYVVTVETGTSPVTFRTSTIDINGDRESLGQAQPIDDFANITSWYENGTANGSSMYRRGHGTGNLIFSKGTVQEFIELSPVDGSLITQIESSGLENFGHAISSNGIAIAFGAGLGAFVNITTSEETYDEVTPQWGGRENAGWPHHAVGSSNSVYTPWGDYVIMVSKVSSADRTAQRFWDRDQFSDYLDQWFTDRSGTL